MAEGGFGSLEIMSPLKVGRRRNKKTEGVGMVEIQHVRLEDLAGHTSSTKVIRNVLVRGPLFIHQEAQAKRAGEMTLGLVESCWMK